MHIINNINATYIIGTQGKSFAYRIGGHGIKCGFIFFLNVNVTCFEFKIFCGWTRIGY